MKKINNMIKLVIALAAFAFIGTGTANADIEKRKLQVVVGPSADSFTANYEIPFFRKWLEERSGGKITANAVSLTELGLSGYETLDLLKLGTNDISWGVIGYISKDSPIVEGLELPGLTNNLDVFRQALTAYRALLSSEVEKKFNAKIMALYVLPKLQAYCKLSDDEIKNFTLATLKGKKVRVHSTAYADFAESLGAIPVTMSFGDVVPAMQRGVLDCAITAPNAAYGAKMQQVANAVIDLPAGYSTHFLAMNKDSWNSLNSDTQAFLSKQFAWLEDQFKTLTVTSTKESADCLHDGPCAIGEPAHMALITMSDTEKTALKADIQNTVLKRWAKRCGKGCADRWNGMVGSIFDLKATP